jgi:hypothetical protein
LVGREDAQHTIQLYFSMQIHGAEQLAAHVVDGDVAPVCVEADDMAASPDHLSGIRLPAHARLQEAFSRHLETAGR